MIQMLKSVFVLAFTLYLPTVSVGFKIIDHQFRFPCGCPKRVDYCIKDVTYCDLSDIVLGPNCRECNKDVCNEENPNEQCYYYCKGLLSTTPATSKHEPFIQREYANSQGLIACIFIFGLAIVILLILVIICSKSRWRDKLLSCCKDTSRYCHCEVDDVPREPPADDAPRDGDEPRRHVCQPTDDDADDTEPKSMEDSTNV